MRLSVLLACVGMMLCCGMLECAASLGPMSRTQNARALRIWYAVIADQAEQEYQEKWGKYAGELRIWLRHKYGSLFKHADDYRSAFLKAVEIGDKEYVQDAIPIMNSGFLHKTALPKAISLGRTDVVSLIQAVPLASCYQFDKNGCRWRSPAESINSSKPVQSIAVKKASKSRSQSKMQWIPKASSNSSSSFLSGI